MTMEDKAPHDPVVPFNSIVLPGFFLVCVLFCRLRVSGTCCSQGNKKTLVDFPLCSQMFESFCF